MTNKVDSPQGCDDYRVVQNAEPGTRDFGRWFVVGGNRKMLTGNPQSYSTKASANNLLKRLNEGESRMRCPMCQRTATELRGVDACPIDSINCTDHHRFPSKELPPTMYRVETRNDLETVYAAIQDPVTMALDRQDLPILGFRVVTRRFLVKDEQSIPIEQDEILELINGEY